MTYPTVHVGIIRKRDQKRTDRQCEKTVFFLNAQDKCEIATLTTRKSANFVFFSKHLLPQQFLSIQQARYFIISVKCLLLIEQFRELKTDNGG